MVACLATGQRAVQASLHGIRLGCSPLSRPVRLVGRNLMAFVSYSRARDARFDAGGPVIPHRTMT